MRKGEHPKKTRTANGKEVVSTDLLAFIADIQNKHSNRVWLELDDDGSGSINTYSCCDDEILVSFNSIEQLCKLIKG